MFKKKERKKTKNNFIIDIRTGEKCVFKLSYC